MCELNVYDVCEIQESLEAYLKVLEWLPAPTPDEETMKEERIKYTKYLIEKCEKVIQGEKIWSMKDE
jgi:hypothetical protein